MTTSAAFESRLVYGFKELTTGHFLSTIVLDNYPNVCQYSDGIVRGNQGYRGIYGVPCVIQPGNGIPMRIPQTDLDQLHRLYSDILSIYTPLELSVSYTKLGFYLATDGDYCLESCDVFDTLDKSDDYSCIWDGTDEADEIAAMDSDTDYYAAMAQMMREEDAEDGGSDVDEKMLQPPQQRQMVAA